jgi:glyoxylase-like metal-dependent hydrolase (beta-lactamase superfamily II)
MSALRVHHLNCAHLAAATLEGRPLACHVLLVELANGELALVDTGLGTADYAAISSRLGWGFAHLYAQPQVDPSLAAISQIESLGFSAADVRHIVMTHLDLDHVGGLADFPEASVHVYETELRAAMRRKGFRARARYRPVMWAPTTRFQPYPEAGGRWLGFRAVTQLVDLPPELLFIPLVGHTAGHCGVAVESTDGWLLHAGDAYFDPREVHQARRQCEWRVNLLQQVVTVRRTMRLYNQWRLRELIAVCPDVKVFSAHDPAGFGL